MRMSSSLFSSLLFYSNWSIQTGFEQLLVDDAHSEFPVFGHLLALDAAAAGGPPAPAAPWTARDETCITRFLDANQVYLVHLHRIQLLYTVNSVQQSAHCIYVLFS